MKLLKNKLIFWLSFVFVGLTGIWFNIIFHNDKVMVILCLLVLTVGVLKFLSMLNEEDEKSLPVELPVSQENGGHTKSFLNGCKSVSYEQLAKVWGEELNGQWISAKEKLPEKGRTVLVYDPKEEKEIDKYGTDFLYTDPKGGLHWDWHFDDNDFYWKEFSRFSG